MLTIKGTKLNGVAHLKNMQKNLWKRFILTYLRDADDITFPLFLHCVQLFQKKMLITAPLKQCRDIRAAPIDKAAFRKTVILIGKSEDF